MVLEDTAPGVTAEQFVAVDEAVEEDCPVPKALGDPDAGVMASLPG